MMIKDFDRELVLKALDDAEEYITEKYDEETYYFDDVIVEARITFLKSLGYSLEEAIKINKEVKEFNCFSDDYDVDWELDYMSKHVI